MIQVSWVAAHLGPLLCVLARLWTVRRVLCDSVPFSESARTDATSLDCSEKGHELN
jgi:hypothetical protein